MPRSPAALPRSASTGAGGATRSSRSRRSSATSRRGGGARTSSRRPAPGRRCSASRSSAGSASRRSSSCRTRRCRRSGCAPVRRSAATGASRRPTPSAPISVLTYQALRRLDDPASALGDLAAPPLDRGAREGHGSDAGRGRGRGGDLDRRGRAPARRASSQRITASIKREVARAEHGHLAPRRPARPRRARTARRAAAPRRVGTVVLDECHHLASLWGYVVRAPVEELGDVHVVGLTATPPDELTAERGEALRRAARPGRLHRADPCGRPRALPRALPGAGVADGAAEDRGRLARRARPPLPGAGHGAPRRRRQPDQLPGLAADAAPRAAPRGRGRARLVGVVPAPPSGARPRRRPLPRLGRARAASGSAARRGLPRGSRPRRLARAARGLRAALPRRRPVAPRLPSGTRRSPSALRDLGFNLTRQGIRRGASDVDRLLTTSGAKAIASSRSWTASTEARGEGVRALVLTDGEQPPAHTGDELVGVLRPDAGTAPAAVRALAGDARTAGAPAAARLRPRAALRRRRRRDAARRARRAQAPAGVEGWRFEPEEGTGLARLSARGEDWRPRLWVSLATADLRGRRHEGPGRHARAARRGLGRAVRERPRRPHAPRPPRSR